MRLSRLLFRQKFWQQQKSGESFSKKFNDWFENSRNGFLLQIGFLTAPVVVYPLGSIIVNGPLIGKAFKWRYEVDDEIPEHLQKLIDEVSFLKTLIK